QKDKELTEIKLTRQKSENISLRNDLEFKNKELVTYTLSLSQKNNFLQEIKEKIEAVDLQNPNGEFQSLKRTVSGALETEQNWKEFKLRFEQVHNDFFEQLISLYPQLTPNDLRLC